MMRYFFAIVLMLGLLSPALCDMGSIPFNPKAKILEPNQRALIAFNGREQILILSTDLQADRETKVLEIMPLPSEPSIRKASGEIFKKATDLINSKLPRRVSRSFGSESLSMSAGGVEVPAGRVTQHKRIGAHDVSVTHVTRAEGFVKWAKDYLRSQGVDTPTIPAPLEKVIQEYIREHFTWFVFDVVSLSQKPVTKDALQFRFATGFLYYPMRITRTEQGETDVTLLILTRKVFDANKNCLGLSHERMRMVHDTVTLTASEVIGLSNEIFQMLGQPRTAKIRNWKITGKLNSFTDDVIVGEPKKYIDHLRGRQQRNAPARK